MSDWPTGWREATLRASELPVTQFALDVLSAWRRSTNLPPASSNPLGMPAKGYGVPAYLTTAYGVFPGMPAFRKAFAGFLASNNGVELRHALELSEKYSDAWRAIHALKWPGNTLESEYPIVLLDMVEGEYRSKLQTREGKRRKTTGAVQAPADVHNAMRAQGRALHHAATTYSDARKAMAYIVKGLS